MIRIPEVRRNFIFPFHNENENENKIFRKYTCYFTVLPLFLSNYLQILIANDSLTFYSQKGILKKILYIKGFAL